VVASLDEFLAQPELARLEHRLADRTPRAISTEGNERYAAIALVLRPSAANEPELLMIRRAELERDPWSGHIACPGGRMDAADPDLAHTAMRETLEETGVDLARDGRILGALDDVAPRTPALPPLVIRPFVAIVSRDAVTSPSDEVAEAFWVPLTAFLASSSWVRAVVPIRNVGHREVDAFRYGEFVVWGLTHRALTQFLELLRD
jgi:8-oxo-dGTP pyrophosphatase MutT (NUDIX family)